MESNNVSGGGPAFDQVSLKITSGGYNILGVDEWKRLDITQRLKLMKEGKVTFLKEGKVASI